MEGWRIVSVRFVACRQVQDGYDENGIPTAKEAADKGTRKYIDELPGCVIHLKQ